MSKTFFKTQRTPFIFFVFVSIVVSLLQSCICQANLSSGKEDSRRKNSEHGSWVIENKTK